MIPTVERNKMNPSYIDQIYLDKCGDKNASFNWLYYRLTSVDGLGNPAGKEESTIQICRVRWPSLGDKGTPVDASGHTDLTAAFPAMNKVLAEWGVDHENRGILIGLREREVDIDKPKAKILQRDYGAEDKIEDRESERESESVPESTPDTTR
jgi:hypothetical protein